MTRLTPLVLAVALLGCRDTSGLEVDALSGEIADLTARLEALEADAAVGDTVLADFQSNADATAADIAALEAEVEALSTVDLTETLDAIADVDARIDSLEEAGLATETWVEGQEYMTQEAGNTLDIRIAANADANDANGGLIATNSGSIGSHLESILANAAAASTNAQALSGLDGRVTVAAAAAGQAQTDASRIDAALLTLAGDVSDLDEGVDALDGAVDGLSDRMDAAEATVGGAADELTALADADVSLQSGIDDLSEQSASLASGLLEHNELIAANAEGLDLAGDVRSEMQAGLDGVSLQVQDLRVDVVANRSSSAANAEGLTQASGARSALASDISANTDLIVGVEGDVSFNLEVIESNLTAIETNADGVASNASDIEFTVDAVVDLEQQIVDRAAEFDDILARLDLVEVYTDTMWVSANTASGADSGVIGPMQMDFTKQLADSILYVEYDDNLRTNGSNQACRWEVYFNGQPCSSPGRVAGDFYVSSQNSHKQHEVSGYCRANSGGDFGARDVAISVRVSSSPGYSSDCYTGWRGDQLGVLRVTEAVDPG